MLFPSLFQTSCSSGGGSDTSLLPLLSLLVNNRVTILLKGTYATDDPLGFSEINNNQIFQDGDDPSLITTDLPAYDQLPIYVDVGEVRLSTKSFLSDLTEIQSQTDSEDFWHVVTTERQVYCSQFYSWDSQFDTCMNQGGIVKYQQFMDGTGAEYPGTDPGPGTYLHAGIYFRAIVTGYSRTSTEVKQTEFDNIDVNGASIIPRVNYNPGSTTEAKQFLLPQFFPLHHKVQFGQLGSTTLDSSQSPYVLEVRANLKENLMLHTFENADLQRQTIVAFSDWRKDHAGQYDMGGNVLSRARFYNPTLVSDLRISGGTSSVKHYYAVYYSTECQDLSGVVYCDKNTEQLPLAAVPVRDGNNNRIKNLMPGDYVLQCRTDTVYDGYPETVLSEIPFTITADPGVFDINCACGSSSTTGC